MLKCFNVCKYGCMHVFACGIDNKQHHKMIRQQTNKQIQTNKKISTTSIRNDNCCKTITTAAAIKQKLNTNTKHKNSNPSHKFSLSF